MKHKIPAMQWYTGDWLKDPAVRSMSPAARGVWFDLINFMWESEQRGKLIVNGRAMTDIEIGRLAGLDRSTAQQILKQIRSTNAAGRDIETGATTCRRMIRYEEIRHMKSRAGKARHQQKVSTPPSTPSANGGPSGCSPSGSSPSGCCPSGSGSSETTQQTIAAKAAEFDAFWEAYPRKMGKAAALKKYISARKKTTHEVILAAIDKQKKSPQWKRDNGQYIPHPATWLNQGRWDDEPVMPKLPHIHVAPVEEPAEKEFLAMLDKRFLGAPNGLVSARTDDGDGSGGAGQSDAVPGADPGGDGPTPPV